ncbi:hypothetical protein EBR66_02515 [bacterium]|nr:hypothetical protein [bacterium]
MGVKGLYSYLRGYRHTIVTHTLPREPKLRIGFDAMSMLYTYKSDYMEIYPSLKELQEKGHTLVFILDGKSPVEKEVEVKERRTARDTATQQATVLKEQLATATLTQKEREIIEYSVARLEYQGWHITYEIRQAFQKTLTDMGIRFVKAIHEADDVLTDLAAAQKLDIVVSTDMDFLLSGVPRLWIPFRRSYNGFEEILLSEVLQGEGIEQAGLLDAGILCGVEPLRGRIHIAAHTAFSWMRYYTNIETLLQSNVKDTSLDIFMDAVLLESVRKHFQAHPWESRIRPDHLNECKSFLEAL